ncbi:MAG: alpha/beta hydrolase [Gammaproteobacteria bacterium]|jgi:pimeloyl-ACP methyl ester carboxylesterase|nr:alpha/beta hydrolase [Gammaproteobacteria bacterium]|tara:strand:- start:2252 stop:3244 length:993 start_codon:yes stop_codon:yes gene_type:complete
MKILKIFGFSLLLVAIITGILLYRNPIPVDVVDAKYTSPSSQFLLMENGSRIHYRDEGNRKGLAILLLHGSNASLHTWEPWVEILGAQFRIITLDLPGHGLTGAVPDNDYTTSAHLGVLDTLVKHLALPEFIIGGNSMGGGVSWRYALTHHDKVKALILIDAVGLPEWQLDTKKETPLVFKLLAQPWFRLIAAKLDSYYLVKWGVEGAYNNSPVVTNELIMRYYELALRRGTRQATVTRFSNVDNNAGSSYDMSELTQPTLIIWGEEDSLVPLNTAHRFTEALPNTRLVTFAGVGHVPMEEVPEKSARALVKFIREMVLSEKNGELIAPG